MVIDCLKVIDRSSSILLFKMSDFAGKVIAITGAASGIGRATAEVLHGRGASLALSDVSIDQLKAVVDGLKAITPNQEVTASEVDVTSTEEVDRWFQEIISRFGRLDGAANVAGIGASETRVSEASDEEWERVFSVNSSGV